MPLVQGHCCSERVLPSEKYFRARTNGSSASFFRLSISATLRLRLILRLDTDRSFEDGKPDSEGSKRFCVAAISTLPKHTNTQHFPVCSHSNKTQILRATVCPALAQWGISAQVLPGRCSPSALNRFNYRCWFELQLLELYRTIADRGPKTCEII